MEKTVHPFEAANLGAAPFRFIGCEEKLFVIPGVMAKPGGSCQYCGTGIRWCYWIEGGDGRKFYVGSECVRHTCRPGGPILTAVEKIEKKREREARKAKKAARLATLGVRMEAARAKLAEMPELLAGEAHPFIPYRTKRDYVHYLFANGGEKGRKAACKIVEEAKEAK